MKKTRLHCFAAVVIAIPTIPTTLVLYMGKKAKKGGKPKSAPDETLLWVDPARVRFQHARIRPFFSGCGRSVEETLDALREGKLQPSDIPPIQVIVGPETNEGPWYFSLNNRRLWVFKRLREEGLLPNNKIAVRVREPKSQAEKNRYNVENCALEAKLTREAPPSNNHPSGDETSGTKSTMDREQVALTEPVKSSMADRTDLEQVRETMEKQDLLRLHSGDDDDASSDESSVGLSNQSNPFSALG